MNIKDDLTGKYVLVTGASSGIGKSIVEYISEMGAIVVMVARSKDKLLDIQSKLPNESYVYGYDLQNLEQIEEIFFYINEKGIKLDGFIHSAGLLKSMPLKVNDVALMEQVMTVNYYSFVELMKFFTRKKYSNNGASAIAISSVTPLKADKGRLNYTASKAAINASVPIIAKECLGRKIRVNAILSAFVRTEGYLAELNNLDLNSEIEKSQPMGFIESKHLAYLAGYLLSDYSKYMTGLCVPIDAGYLLS